MMSWRLPEDTLPKALEGQHWSATYLQSKVGVANNCSKYKLEFECVYRIVA